MAAKSTRTHSPISSKQIRAAVVRLSGDSLGLSKNRCFPNHSSNADNYAQNSRDAAEFVCDESGPNCAHEVKQLLSVHTFSSDSISPSLMWIIRWHPWATALSWDTIMTVMPWSEFKELKIAMTS